MTKAHFGNAMNAIKGKDFWSAGKSIAKGTGRATAGVGKGLAIDTAATGTAALGAAAIGGAGVADKVMGNDVNR